MFFAQENELLTRVGAGTPLGELFRRYWIPALLSEEVGHSDAPPVRVRLLEEDLIAFRDSRGRVGLIDEYCSHRGVSLFYGRNEECGLRCVYHGWKYDVEGTLLQTPAEPADSTLPQKIKHTAYPCWEAAGVVFTYMGAKKKTPPFPAYQWLTVPSDHVTVSKFSVDCNYLQCLEGDCDPAHVPFLHMGKPRLYDRLADDRSPDGDLDHQRIVPIAYEVNETSFGLRAVVTRTLGGGKKNLRISTFVMPFIACVPVGKMTNGSLDGFLIVYQTPADDFRTTRFNFRFQRNRPLTTEEINHDRRQIGENYILLANKSNEYLLDRRRQKTVTYTGIPGFRAQDACMTESMGPITDRAKEHLGFSDQYVISLRRYLLKIIRSIQEGVEPPGLGEDTSSDELNCMDVTQATG
jgi:phenylpropionate dioxygenase-like ring-hydroxylating dioxygenase large terminal subunit